MLLILPFPDFVQAGQKNIDNSSVYFQTKYVHTHYNKFRISCNTAVSRFLHAIRRSWRSAPLIQESILSILPEIADINSADHNIHVIRQTVLDYLSEALQNYLNLPPAFANLHPVKNGKTARQLLGEQLDLLDKEMQEIVEDIHRDDAQKLIIHGRFLEDKFNDADLLFGLNQREPARVKME